MTADHAIAACRQTHALLAADLPLTAAASERCAPLLSIKEMPHGIFLAALGADGNQIEASFCEAIRIAREQKSISMATRAQVTYAEYCRHNANAPGGRGFRLTLW